MHTKVNPKFVRLLFSLDQDEEMDTLGSAAPLFTLDTEKPKDGNNKNQSDGSESEDEEDADVPEVEAVEMVDDSETSVTNKASAVRDRQNKDCAQTNGNHSESEESEDEELEDDKGSHTTFKDFTLLSKSQCQSLTS